MSSISVKAKTQTMNFFEYTWIYIEVLRGWMHTNKNMTDHEMGPSLQTPNQSLDHCLLSTSVAKVTVCKMEGSFVPYFHKHVQMWMKHMETWTWVWTSEGVDLVDPVAPVDPVALVDPDGWSSRSHRGLSVFGPSSLPVWYKQTERVRVLTQRGPGSVRVFPRIRLEADLSVHVWIRAAGPTAFARFICYQCMSSSEKTEFPNQPTALGWNRLSQSALLLSWDPVRPRPGVFWVSEATFFRLCTLGCLYLDPLLYHRGLVFSGPPLVLYLDRLDFHV